jgi:DHA2 family multidrug resistance protein-like MFS transporter
MPPKAGRREWIGLAVLTLACLLYVMDLTVLHLAVPAISADLEPTSAQLLWIIDIYGFFVAGSLITMGTLGDRIGRRKLLLIGASAFGVASVLAAYSVSAEMLIVSRALLGIAGATLMPSTLALISNMFKDAKQRGVAIGVWGSCFAGGAAIGPVVGGVLLEFFWWGSVFLLGVPVMALLLLTAPLLLPEYRDTGAGRLDLRSVAMSMAAILPIIYGLKELARNGFGAVPSVTILAGVAVGVAFVRRQRRLTDPLLDVRLFGNRAFSAALGVGLLATVTMGGIFLFVSQYLQLVAGLSPLRAGLWLVPATVGVIAGSMAAPAIAQRIRPGYVVGAGLVVAAFGFLLLTQVDGGLPVLVTGNVIASFGIGPMGVLCAGLVVGSAPPNKAGSAASVSETSGEFGIALGIAALGSVGAAAYRHQITDNMPSGVPAEAAEATRESIAGATAAAEQLPAGLGAELLEGAREAFTNGLNVVAGIGTVTVVIFAVLAVALLRHVPPSGAAQPAQASPDHAAEADSIPAAAPGADRPNKVPAQASALDAIQEDNTRHGRDSAAPLKGRPVS